MEVLAVERVVCATGCVACSVSAVHLFMPTQATISEGVSSQAIHGPPEHSLNS